MSQRTRNGFTLVELLVVIGIIAVLMGILIPTLSRARESANRIKCASQLRQMGQYVAIYANMYKNFLPVGWLSNDSYSPGTSTIWYSKRTDFTNGPVGLGHLFSANIIKSDKASVSGRTLWYCPNMPTSWRFSMDKAGHNPWVEMPVTDAEAAAWTGGGGSISLKMGYSSRSALSSQPDYEQTLKWTAPTTGGTATSWTRPVYTGVFTGEKAAKVRSTSVLKSKAIVSDLLGDPRLVNGVHKNGVNVLYASYAVKWVPVEHFKTDLALTSISPNPAANYLHAGGSTALHRIWETFDRQQ
jgi:prepilin-type N-terminal cleavage/methylation domain-containing protein